MRQVLLVKPQEENLGMTECNDNGEGEEDGSASHPYANSHHHPKPLVMWMNDDAWIGDTLVWRGEVWTVSAIYGTHLSTAAFCGKCDKPKKRLDSGSGIAVPIDR